MNGGAVVNCKCAVVKTGIYTKNNVLLFLCAGLCYANSVAPNRTVTFKEDIL